MDYNSSVTPADAGIHSDVEPAPASSWTTASAGATLRADSGRLLGIARRSMTRAPMERLDRALIGVNFGVEGDFRGLRKGKNKRQITLLSRQAWETACAELGRDVPWTVRRANLFVEDLDLPREPGTIVAIGDVRLEMTIEIDPCVRMDEQVPGLFAALKPDWRGGIGCRVLRGGVVTAGDRIWIEEQA